MGYEAVGDALTNIGLAMIQREWSKRDRAEDLAAEQARSDREFALRQQELEASNLAKQEYLREKDRLDRERAEVEAIRKHGYDMEKVKLANEGKVKAAEIKAKRPLMAREPASDVYEVDGQLTRVGRDQPIPKGARLPSRGGEQRANDDLTPGQAASVLQTYRKNLGMVDEGNKQRPQTLREAMAGDGLDYDTIVARAQGKRRPLMAQDKPGIMDSMRSAASSFAEKARAMPAPAKPSAPSGGPKPGDVMDGFQFMGGDPADRASWRKL